MTIHCTEPLGNYAFFNVPASINLFCGCPYNKITTTWGLGSIFRGPKHHINTRILNTMISGILFILGLGTKTTDPYVDVVVWAPNISAPDFGKLPLGAASSAVSRCASRLIGTLASGPGANRHDFGRRIRPLGGGTYNWLIWGFPKIRGPIFGGFQKSVIRGPIFGSPYNKNPIISGCILGPLVCWSLPSLYYRPRIT